MLSLRSAVVALVASAALVLVLAGVSAGVFTAPSATPPIGQSASVHQGVAAPAAPAPPDTAVPEPAVPAPAATVPAAPAHAAPAPAAPGPAADAPAVAPAEPVTHYRQVQVVPQQPQPMQPRMLE